MLRQPQKALKPQANGKVINSVKSYTSIENLRETVHYYYRLQDSKVKKEFDELAPTYEIRKERM